MKQIRIRDAVIDRRNFPHCRDGQVLEEIVRARGNGVLEISFSPPQPGVFFCKGPAGTGRDAYNVTVRLVEGEHHVDVVEIQCRTYDEWVAHLASKGERPNAFLARDQRPRTAA